MNHREAFKKTKRYYGITGTKLHKQTGVSQNHISEFINGKSKISTEILDSLVNGMEELEPGSKLFYVQELLGKKLQTFTASPEELINSMNNQQMSECMFAIARRMGGNKQSRYTEEEELAITY